MKKLFFCLCSLALFSFLTVEAVAQIDMPAPSPGAKLTQTVGLTDITIEYSRPGMKDRVIFAKDGLVPFDKMWRTGANAATKITLSDDVKIGGADLKAGSYAILTKPGADKWMVNFYPYESGSWSGYTEKDPAASVSAEPGELPLKVENFTINFGDLKPSSANLYMYWAQTIVSIPVEVAVKDKVEAQIKQVMGGPTQNDYFAAATYYHEMGGDLEKALTYINKATNEDPKFWQVRRKALILADMGKKEEAVKAAKQSMELAQKAGNEDYVRMNKKSIEEWTAMKK